jgi:hypothetical protein
MAFVERKTGRRRVELEVLLSLLIHDTSETLERRVLHCGGMDLIVVARVRLENERRFRRTHARTGTGIEIERGAALELVLLNVVAEQG